MPPEMLLQGLQQLTQENHGVPIMTPSAVAVADMTVLERQIARLHRQLQQQQPPPCYFATPVATDTSLASSPYSIQQPSHILPSTRTVGLHTAIFCDEQGMINHDLSSGSAGVWPDLTQYPILCNTGVGGDGGGAISRTFSCPPLVDHVDRRKLSLPASQLDHASTTKVGLAATAVAAISTGRTRESPTKRKSIDNAATHKLEEDNGEKKKMIKVENTEPLVIPKVESPSIMSSSTAITTTNNCKENNREASSSASKKMSKAPELPPKTDYIHVRARRGQATDSHSLAERVRREKISERMKLLQDLVPGCNKITGKAGMLDEIINYVQSLQRQVEFLSMKLAAVTPALDLNLDALFTKEMSTLAGGCGLPAHMGLPPELLGLSFLQFNPLQQQAVAAAAAAECYSLPMPVVNTCCPAVEESLCGIAATPVTAPESSSLPDSCSVLVPTSSATTGSWDGDLQRFYGSMEGF